MITDYGMSARFRNVALTTRAGMPGSERQEPMFHREYSEATQQYIDEEIAHILEDRFSKVKGILSKKRKLLDRVSTVLQEKESLDEKEFNALVKEGA
jgi:cell division protease FtsH